MSTNDNHIQSMESEFQECGQHANVITQMWGGMRGLHKYGEVYNCGGPCECDHTC